MQMHEHIPKNHLQKYVYKYDSFYNVFFWGAMRAGCPEHTFGDDPIPRLH